MLTKVWLVSSCVQGNEPLNDWVGYSDAWRTSVPIVAPSIVQAYYYDQLGSNSVTSYLPNAGGYFVWANTPPTPPGPGGDCVRFVSALRGAVHETGACLAAARSHHRSMTTSMPHSKTSAAARSRAWAAGTCATGKFKGGSMDESGWRSNPHTFSKSYFRVIYIIRRCKTQLGTSSIKWTSGVCSYTGGDLNTCIVSEKCPMSR